MPVEKKKKKKAGVSAVESGMFEVLNVFGCCDLCIKYARRGFLAVEVIY